MPDIFRCDDCGCYVRVMSYSKHNDGLKCVDIEQCPHCLSYNIREIRLNKFISKKQKVWLRVNREYRFKHIGKRIIEMSVKYND